MSGGLRALVLIGAVALAGTISAPVTAQNLGVPVSPILTLDSEKVFAATNVGQQITKELENRVAALAAENRQIEAELEAEEKDLTEKRATMDPTAFRALADAFDAKVQAIRVEQDAKQRDLQQQREADRQSFVDAIGPILSQIGREHGAVAIMERRDLLLSADGIDITQEAIDRINAALENVPDTGAADPAAANE